VKGRTVRTSSKEGSRVKGVLHAGLLGTSFRNQGINVKGHIVIIRSREGSRVKGLLHAGAIRNLFQ
jgi:hypothetical protein